MSLQKFNSGEWSEFYAFIKILEKRFLSAADSNLQPIEGVSYPVDKILHDDKDFQRIYDLSDEAEISVKIYSDDYNEEFSVPYEVVGQDLSKILAAIKAKKNSKGSFPVPEADELRAILKNGAIKKGSRSKEDIVLSIRDQVTSQNTVVGFSIKSYIGGQATILNVSGATKFTYYVRGFSGDFNSVNEISGHRKLRRRVEKVHDEGGTLSYCRMENSVFEQNLRMIDSLLPEIISEMIMGFFSGHGNKISDLVEYVIAEKKLNGPILKVFEYDDIKFKIKQLLLNAALGMVPATRWDGLIKADGGYVIVKEDGDVVCYHIYNISQLGEYLFHNTRLETGSSKSWKFGSFFKSQDELFYQYCLQIRFI